MWEFLKFLLTGRRPLREGELIPGVPKPSELLAGIVNQKILENFLSIKETRFSNPGFYTSYAIKVDNIDIRFTLGVRDKSYFDHISCVHFNNKSFPFNEKESTEILKTLKIAYKLLKEKNLCEKEHERQLRAVDEIEKILKGNKNEIRSSQRSSPRILQYTSGTF